MCKSVFARNHPGDQSRTDFQASGNGAVMKQSNQGGALAYRGGLEAVLSIPVGAGLGYWIDSLVGSDPYGLLMGVSAGFGAFVLQMVRLSKKLERLRSEQNGDEKPIASSWDQNTWDPWDDEEKDNW